MSLEEKIDELIVALNRNTDFIEMCNLNFPSQGATGKEVKEEPKVEPVKKPIDTKKVTPVKAEKKVVPAPVPNNKPPMSFDSLRLKVLFWLKPLTDEERNEEAQAAMVKLMDKFTGGKRFEIENVPPEHYQNILDYIAEVKPAASVDTDKPLKDALKKGGK